MCGNEVKYCPRCAKTFECKAGSITQCHCYGMNITVEQQAFIADRYADCLCKDCLRVVQTQVELFKEKFIYRGS